MSMVKLNVKLISVLSARPASIGDNGQISLPKVDLEIEGGILEGVRCSLSSKELASSIGKNVVVTYRSAKGKMDASKWTPGNSSWTIGNAVADLSAIDAPPKKWGVQAPTAEAPIFGSDQE